MTNQQGAPEALALARAVDHWARCDYGLRGDEMRKAAAELRRLHYENERLAALVEAQQPATHVQNPAEIEHVAGDVSKNWPESNMAQQPAPSAAAAPEGGPPGSGGWEKHAIEMERQRDYYRQRCHTMEEHQNGGVWYWQGDDGDSLESMGNSMLVVIRADQLRSLMQPSPTPQADSAPTSGKWVSADDVNRLVRELDVALNGEAGAAVQASLCDVVAQVRLEAAKRDHPLLAPQGEPWHGHHFKEVRRGYWQCSCGKVIAEAASTASKGFYPSLPNRHAYDDDGEEVFTADQMRAYVDADRAARIPADSVTAPAGPTDAQIDACARSMLYQPWGIGSRIEDARAFAKRILSKFAPPAQAADSVLEDAARWFAERDNVLQSLWVLLGEAEAQADNDNNPLLKHQVEGFYRQWNALNGTTLGPRWVTRAARKQGGAA